MNFTDPTDVPLTRRQLPSARSRFISLPNGPWCHLLDAGSPAAVGSGDGRPAPAGRLGP